MEFVLYLILPLVALGIVTWLMIALIGRFAPRMLQGEDHEDEH